MPTQSHTHTHKSVRREAWRDRKHRVHLSDKLNIKKLALILIIPIFVVVLFLMMPSVWSGDQKLILATFSDEGSVNISLFDTVSDSIITLKIPESLEVDVARHLGKWRLKSVQKLGEKEGLGGILLTETLTKYLKFPVYVWGDKAALGFQSGNLPDAINAAVLPYQTNLTIKDRIKLFYFSLGIKNYKRDVIDLTQTRYLKKDVLSDGEDGYSLSGKIPTSISVLFSEPNIASLSARVQVVDRTEEKIGDSLGEVVEVMGMKVVSVKKENSEKMDCEIQSDNKVILNYISPIFKCRTTPLVEKGFDAVIIIGSEFEKRF